jgi:hypothetical protein
MPIGGRNVKIYPDNEGTTHLLIPGTGRQAQRCFCNSSIFINKKKIKEGPFEKCPVLTCSKCEQQRQGLARFWERVDALKEAGR